MTPKQALKYVKLAVDHRVQELAPLANMTKHPLFDAGSAKNAADEREKLREAWMLIEAIVLDEEWWKGLK